MALATMVSNTGCTSVGELEIAWRTSLVAVRSRLRACSSVNSRTFSIAITVSERLEERYLVAGESAGFAACERDCSDRFVVTKHWHHHPASVATSSGADVFGFGQSGIGLGIGDV